MKSPILFLLLCLSLTTLTTASAKKLKKFKTQEALCAYLEDKKDKAEDRMHQGYTVKQYNKLEANRKYWKNLYIDHCF
ncbi:MAG TPA: hypothetical protein EYG71_04915 [Leucothrix sp.]|nr:hypothetical protein [Leucothrix sp.]